MTVFSVVVRVQGDPLEGGKLSLAVERWKDWRHAEVMVLASADLWQEPDGIQTTLNRI